MWAGAEVAEASQRGCGTAMPASHGGVGKWLANGCRARRAPGACVGECRRPMLRLPATARRPAEVARAVEAVAAKMIRHAGAAGRCWPRGFKPAGAAREPCPPVQAAQAGHASQLKGFRHAWAAR